MMAIHDLVALKVTHVLGAHSTPSDDGPLLIPGTPFPPPPDDLVWSPSCFFSEDIDISSSLQ